VAALPFQHGMFVYRLGKAANILFQFQVKSAQQTHDFPRAKSAEKESGDESPHSTGRLFRGSISSTKNGSLTILCDVPAFRHAGRSWPCDCGCGIEPPELQILPHHFPNQCTSSHTSTRPQPGTVPYTSKNCSSSNSPPLTTGFPSRLMSRGT